MWRKRHVPIRRGLIARSLSLSAGIELKRASRDCAGTICAGYPLLRGALPSGVAPRLKAEPDFETFLERPVRVLPRVAPWHTAHKSVKSSRARLRINSRRSFRSFCRRSLVGRLFRRHLSLDNAARRNPTVPTGAVALDRLLRSTRRELSALPPVHE